MIPTVENTLQTIDGELAVKLNKTLNHLDIYGEADLKHVNLLFLLIDLLKNPYVDDDAKILLNIKLIELRNLKIH
jgi:hypothetical protein